MKVGITGSTGFIGRYIVRDYCNEFDFIAPVIDELVDTNSATYLFSDYSVESLTNAFEGCDAVIHLAAKVWKKNSDPVPLGEYMKNTLITANVFEACKNNNIKKIIHASSRAVFDWQKDSLPLIDEEITSSPKNAYGVGKVCDEVLAKFCNDVYDMQIMSYRFPEVCGVDLNLGLFHPFWGTMLKKCKEGGSVPLYGKGEAARDLLYVKDAARALVRGLTANKKGIYNIGSGMKTTNKEIAEAFCEVFDNKLGIEMHPEKPEWGVQGVLNPKRANIDLGFKTSYSIVAMVRDIKIEEENRA